MGALYCHATLPCLREGTDQATWRVHCSISRGLPRLQEKQGKLGRSREGKWLQQNCTAQWGYSWGWTPGFLTPSPVLLPHQAEDRPPALCLQVGWERSCGVSWEVMYCPGQGLQKQWQGEISLTRDNSNVDFKHSKSSRALWKTGSAPNAECPLCLEFSTCNSISRTTDIITAPQGTERPDSAPPKLMNKIVQDRKEMRIRENVPPSLWGWSSETWNQTTWTGTSLLLHRMKGCAGKGMEEALQASGASLSHYHASQRTFHWGNKKEPGPVGLDTQDLATDSKCDLGSVTSPHWPLVSLYCQMKELDQVYLSGFSKETESIG